MESKFDYKNNPTWRIFRIMAEFVDGFNFLSDYEQTVTFFGSARLPSDHPACQAARQLAEMLSTAGFTIITGGGPGIMEAANHGAYDAGNESLGLNIELPLEQRANPYITKGIGFNHFYTRKVMLAYSAEALVFFPGGLGTLDEFSELVTLLQTKKIEEHIPVILFDSKFWNPMLKWIHETMYQEYRTIDARDQHIWKVTDSVDEAYQIIKETLPKGRRIKLHHETDSPLSTRATRMAKT